MKDQTFQIEEYILQKGKKRYVFIKSTKTIDSNTKQVEIMVCREEIGKSPEMLVSYTEEECREKWNEMIECGYKRIQ